MRAKVRAFALAIASDVGPVNNLRVLRYLKRAMGHEQAAIDDWYRHWADERGSKPCAGAAAGDATTASASAIRRLAGRHLPHPADVQRAPLQQRPLRRAAAWSPIDAAARALPAFAKAAPEAQPMRVESLFRVLCAGVSYLELRRRCEDLPTKYTVR